jgi:hypothetical protein
VGEVRKGPGGGGSAADSGTAADEVHSRCGGGPGWIVGTAADPWDLLEARYGVSLETGRFAVVQCADAGIALGAARLLVWERGYRKGRGCAGADCVYLYAFPVADAVCGPR